MQRRILSYKNRFDLYFTYQIKTEEQERIMKRKVEQYCKKKNFKANTIAQLNQGIKEISQQSYRAIINYIFEHTGIAGLIFYGHTDDINEIKKIFQAREEVFSYCVQDLA